MKYNLILILFILFSGTGFSQEKITLSGTISNSADGEKLFGVNVLILENNSGTVTNENGSYLINLPRGEYTIVVSSMGFQEIREKVNLQHNTKKDFNLEIDSNQLEEVVIAATDYKTDIRTPEMSVNKIKIETIKKMPVVMGEVDVLKSILQFPGVSSANEGSTGFNVRGGSADANLVILDDAVIYNTAHLFGFFSVFNSDVVDDMKLIKGGIPSMFGGRTSSVLDIRHKNGNTDEIKGNGGIGLISSRLMLEGPLVNDKASFVVAGRTSYAHLFMKMAGENNSASFYDLNAKFDYRWNDRNRLSFVGYYGLDNLEIKDFIVNNYDNTMLNTQWSHRFSESLLSNTSLIYSKYNYRFKLDFIGLNWESEISNYNFKYDLKHFLKDNITLDYGVSRMYYQFNPGTIRAYGEKSFINSMQLTKKHATESALYINSNHELSDKISINYGLRFSYFERLGQEGVSIYENDEPVVFNPEFQVYEEAIPIGSIDYKKNKKLISYHNFEPRFGMSYAINEEQSIKLSYNRMSQYIHLISNTASVTPLDVWAPSDAYLKPELSDQIAIGYFRNFKDDNYSLEIESFYKKITNKADYIDGAELIAHEAIERVLLNGEARAYGLEVLTRKNTGKLTGWLSYTLSRAEQRTPGRNALEPGINNGNWYRANYDKLHNLSITTSYALNDKWSFGGIFTFQSGKAATFPIGKYQYQGITIVDYGARNKNSLSAFHHLDLSATYTPKPKHKNWQSEWVFSVYNAYNRKNAASYTFNQNDDSGLSEVKRISIFGIIPSVTYNFKF